MDAIWENCIVPAVARGQYCCNKIVAFPEDGETSLEFFRLMHTRFMKNALRVYGDLVWDAAGMGIRAQLYFGGDSYSSCED